MKHLLRTGFLLLLSLTVLNVMSLQAQDWQLVWSDEFDGNSLDESKWSYQFGTGASEGLSGWGNNELQYYTDREENVFVQNGNLHIVAREESYQGRNYTSARLRSIDQGDWRYGRFEIRAKVPEGQGIWPAIWMMPTDDVYGRWPASGEIDIMELVGHEPNVVHGTIHYGPPHTYSGGSLTKESGAYSDEFHTYALEWERGEMRWYIDGEHYHTETNWFTDEHDFPAPFEQRFHLLLNVAVGGNWPGSPDHTTEFPQEMVIDYVRVYQDAEAEPRVSLPLTFEDRFFNWDDAFTGFEGGSVSVVENPDPDNTNNSGWVGMMVKDGGEYRAGATFEAERSFSFSGELNEITMNVWSPRPDVPILIKMEQQNGDAEYEIVQQTTESGQWEKITWNVPASGYNEEWDIITLIFDYEEGQIGDGSDNYKWFFDNLDVFGAIEDVQDDPGGMLPVSLPLTFEDDGFDWTRAFTGFSGGEITVVENPAPDDLNDSNWVGRMVKDGGAFWGGAFMMLEEPFVFDEENHTISMKVWSPRENVQVLMKMEQELGEAEYEITEPTTTSGEWEELVWDMSGAGFDTEWDIITLIFDFEDGQIGDGSENFTWYFDDLEVFAAGMPISVEEGGDNQPRSFNLEQNYPNPFNPTTNISFELPEQSEILLEVYDATGRRVTTLASGSFSSGHHTMKFDASNLASGLYIYRMRSGLFTKTQKMMLLK